MPWTFYNSSGQQLKSGQTAISNLDIDGATDIGAAIVDADLFIIDDGAGGTNRKTEASRLKTYIGSAATQAEMRTGTSNTVFATPGRTVDHSGVAKAWVQDNTNSSSANSSYNIASVSNDSTGVQTVTFDADFSGTQYARTGSVFESSIGHMTISNNAAGSVKVRTFNSSNSATNLDYSMACFGEQVDE